MASSQTFTLNIKALFDASDVKAKVGDIQSSLSKLKLPDKLGADLNKSFTGVNKALDDFISRTEKGIKTKSDASGITKSFENVTKELNNLDNLMVKVKGQLGDGVDLSKIIKFDGSVKEKLESINNEIKQLQQQINSINTNKLQQLQNALSQIKSKGALSQGNKALELFKQGDLEGSLQTLNAIISKLEALKTANDAQGHNTSNLTASLDALRTMQTTVQEAQRETTGLVEQQNAKIAEGAQVAKQAADDYAAALNKDIDALHQVSGETSGLTTKINDLAAGQAQFVREVDQVKSRIQYFFGLTNAINLVKRAIRGAVDTIKDLDKAMTETAVVTDFTVSDMWKQLPEYTKRANELGVTTQAAYEAATLYYQQGLNNEEVNALSVETLKMARIAGLDAAEATDRMTNALRGFNMELDTQSAQRVDDVYSELAANTASNVDEISTAMTKVASLAHSANMEFETTAAFLAQIIETTRESAETAGTALKTVVARFSEVKKLVDTNQLKGQDEEGQVVDVNKVSAALRTAGIDLNKYFLGEVGLDDIFMELASKWDSLTSVQQRYIATQAAGSRQQSRFIALMQDYARTQELVGKAYNAEGASARQFEKTQESLESKLNRLKNAWNEFLMGLTNNVMVKTFVDALTNLLNLVNSLTSAFGDGVGSILKWVAALGTLGGLRKLFTDGGLATQLIGSLMGHGLGANKIRASMGLGTINEVGQYSQYSAEQLKANRGVTLLGGLGGLGKKAWGSAKDLGYLIGGNFGTAGAASGAELTGSAGMAAGLTGIATALGAIAVAAGVAYTAYKLWLNLTPEGQLKQAKQYANAMQDIADADRERANNLKTIQSRYSEYNEAISSAGNISERSGAIADRNDYLTSLLKQDATYAQYISSVIDESGQFVLTLDEAALAEAANLAAEAAVKSAASSNLLAANVSRAQAAVYQANIDRIGAGAAELSRDLTPAESAQIKIYESQIAALTTAAQNETAAAARQLLTSSGLKSETANALADVYAKSFDSQQYQTQLKRESGVGQFLGNDFWRGLSGNLQQEYEAIYGVGSSAGKKWNDMSLAVASNKLTINEEGKLTSAAKLVSSGAYDDILKAITGEIDFDTSTEGLDAAKDRLEAFANALQVDTKDIEGQIKANQKARQEIKKGRQADIFEQALRSGHGVTQQFSDIIKSLDFDKLGIVSDIVSQAAGKVSENALESLFDTLPTMADDQLQQLQTFFNSFSLDNPISALDQLNKKIAEVGANSPFGKLLADIQETNAALFESSNLVQSFLLSESYESLSDSIEDATKENKKLTGKNIKEMAESCKELDTLLDELKANFEDNIDEAQALADAINLIGEGALSIDQITDSLLAALGAGKSFESMIDDVTSWIEDFDEGTDLKTGTEHITSELDNLKKYVENWEFGNEPTENIYDHIFGKGQYKELLKDYVNDTKTDFVGLEQELTQQIEHWSSLAENEGLGGIQKALSSGQVKGLSQIAGTGGEFFKWDLMQYTSTVDAIQDVASALGVGQEAAEAFILSWQTHMPLLRTEWNDLQLHDALTAFNTDLDTSNIVTQQELDALAEKFGKTSDEIKNAINDIRKEADNPIEITVVDWTDSKGGNLEGQDLIDKFNTTMGVNKKKYQYLGISKDDYSDFLGDIKNVSRTVQDDLGQTFDTIDFGTLHDHLTEALKLTPAQATEVANHIADETGKKLSTEIQIPVKASDGSIETIPKVITAPTEASLQAGIDAAMQAANYALVAEELADQDVSAVGANLEDAITTGIAAGAGTLSSAVSSAAEGVSVTIPVYYEAQNPEVLTGQGATGGIVVGVAKGGQVNSYASGSAANRLSPGVALTGEEGPEIVWNKQKGYAYITGEHYPQFQNLQPGDRVFNAQETRKILNGSLAKGGLIDSYASGGWKPTNDNSSSGGGGSSSSDSSDDEDDEWKNEIDWLYNLVEDIAELERKQVELQEQYDDYLTDDSKTGRDLYNLLVQQLGNLYTQLEHQNVALAKREQEMREFMDTTNEYDEYLWYNWEDRTLEIDWDKIEALQDEDTYNEIKDLIDEAEEIQDKMDDAEDAIQDIENQIEELENIWRDTFTDFEDRVYDAIVKQYQTVIDNYSELNDTLNNSNSQILDSLQKQISLQRQIRDNTKTEEQISDNEARLAYLRRDTTGGNDLAAMQLQKELDEQRQDYEDNLVDQAINRLQEDNDAAAQQRQQQIDIMQAQLDYQSQNGEFNEYVRELLTSAMGADGELLTNSDLMTLLKEQENWSAMSAVSQEVWEEELNGTFKEVAAFLLKQNAEENGTFYTALTSAVNSVSTAIGSYSQAMTKLGSEVASAASGGGGGSGGGSSSSSGSYNTNGTTTKNTQGIGTVSAKSTLEATAKAAEVASRGYGTIAEYTNQLRNKGLKFATGGLATSTGFAWLDGTLSEPEYVLNARQTDAFLKLADVLPNMMNTSAAGDTNMFGSTFNFAINLDSVSPDYDVERMVNLVKEKLYDSGTYRNVNSLSFLR